MCTARMQWCLLLLRIVQSGMRKIENKYSTLVLCISYCGVVLFLFYTQHTHFLFFINHPIVTNKCRESYIHKKRGGFLNIVTSSHSLYAAMLPCCLFISLLGKLASIVLLRGCRVKA